MKKIICFLSLYILAALIFISCSNNLSSTNSIKSNSISSGGPSITSSTLSSLSSESNSTFSPNSDSNNFIFFTNIPENLLYITPEHFPLKDPKEISDEILEAGCYIYPYIIDFTREEYQIDPTRCVSGFKIIRTNGQPDDISFSEGLAETGVGSFWHGDLIYKGDGIYTAEMRQTVDYEIDYTKSGYWATFLLEYDPNISITDGYYLTLVDFEYKENLIFNDLIGQKILYTNCNYLS